MKTGIYIHSGSGTGFVGVQKKIDDQIGILSQYFDVTEVVIKKEKTSLLKSMVWRMPGGSWGAHYRESFNIINSINEEKNGVGFFYIRIRPLDRRFVEFLKAIRHSFPESKIILEYPQYPYLHEYLHSSTMWPWALKDIVYRHNIRKIADRIVTYSDDDSIMGITTIRTMNGITVHGIKYKKDIADDCIDLIAVASMQRHHGYERIIRGIKRYVSSGGDRNIKLHLVGQGPQNEYYKSLSVKLGIADRIVFWGNKHGEELEELFEMADIGLGSMGFHLIGAQNTISSTLKTREYLAHGLPFLSACNEDIFMKYPDTGFFRHYPDDETDIPIDDVIRFYDELLNRYSGNEDRLREDIHEFAAKTVDMSVVMRPVVDFIKS